MKDGDEVIFIASAKDNFPEREPTLSKPLKMQIIGPEKHAEMIRSQIDSVISEISEIARSQEGVQFETLSAEERIRKSSDQKLDSKQTGEISNLEKDQNDLAKRLNATARNGSNILNEAAKNSLFDPELLQEFATSLREIRETSSGTMSESEKNKFGLKIRFITSKSGNDAICRISAKSIGRIKESFSQVFQTTRQT